MAGRSRLSIAKADIVQTLDDSGQRIFRHSDLAQIMASNAADWRLAQSTTVNAFIDYLVKNAGMKRWRAAFPQRPVIRYVWQGAQLLELVQSIDPLGYLSHYSALAIHQLTEQLPKTIYFNFEQVATGGDGQLSQVSIDRAFRSKCRVSNNIAEVEERRIYQLRGKNTGNLGVTSIESPHGNNLRVTNIERTLIDATVRPVYSGGVFEVAKCFREAASQISVNRLCAYLRQLNYTYPYHQAIGFYMEQAGVYKKSQMDLLKQFEINFDFYLTHAMREKHYVKAWRLYVPSGF
jgi:predicted transcriptional regulator of viral defense system